MRRPTASPHQPYLGQYGRHDDRPAPWASVRSSALFAATLAVLITGAECRADRLYGYADERGVFNFSDAPSDPRHRLFLDLRPPGAEPRLAATRRIETVPRRSPGQLSPLIHDAARLSGVDPALIEAVAYVESNFAQRARSPKGAMGLMQLMPATAMRFGVGDPFDPQQNLLGGARYLRELLDRFDSLPLALAAYNAGEGAVVRHGNAIPPFAETSRYVPTVLGHYKRLRTNRQHTIQASGIVR